MTSTTSSASTRVPNGTRGSTRPSRPQHLPARWEESAALAHGSPSPYYGRSGAAATARGPNPTAVYRDMERGPALAPELDNRRDAPASTMMRSARSRAAEEPQPKRSGGGGLMRRMFERRDDSGSKPPGFTTTTRPRISAPSAPLKAEKVMMPPGFAYTLPAGATSGSSLDARGPPPPRPTRPPVELSPAPPLAGVPMPGSGSGISPELAALKAAAVAARAQASKPVVIRPERLGTAAQALRSHPVRAPDLLMARKAYNRKTSVVAMPTSHGSDGVSGGSCVMEMHPDRSVQSDREALELPVPLGGGGRDDADNDVMSTKASRRCGMVFDTAPLSLTSFPEPVFSPEATAADSGDDDHHDHQQQRGEGESKVEAEPKPEAISVVAVEEEEVLVPAAQPLSSRGAVVPAVVLTPPREPARTTVDHLTADYPYKRQLRRERAEMRAAIARWEPVGELLCGASGGAVDDPADPEALAGVLEQLADDSARYCALRPTLDLLARDRRVSVEDPDALAQGIVDVLNVRNQAVAAAAHHKKKARALERRLEALAGAGVAQ